MQDGNTLLHYAIELRQVPAARLLIEDGRLVGINKQDGTTPFELAARAGLWEVMESIQVCATDQSVSPITNNWGQNLPLPLHKAALNNSVALLGQLVSHHDVNEANWVRFYFDRHHVHSQLPS